LRPSLYKTPVEVISYLVTAVAAYLLGSIPTGYLVAKGRGIDIRTVGSGNIGATNVFRILGKPAGIFVLLVDALKGFLACQFVGALAYRWLVSGSGWDTASPVAELHKIIGGVCAILGHNYTCWLKFKGGKGIATSAGVILALLPLAMGIAFGAWLLLFLVTRYVSVASMGAAFVLPFAAWGTGYSRRMILVAAAIGALAIYKHRTNIQRLRAGTESRFGKKREAAP
jgi:acyl phosphate:glycerol-3-phosphate acyltransferase